MWGEGDRSYRKLSLKYHPDKQTVENGAEAREKFVKITNGGRLKAREGRWCRLVCERMAVLTVTAVWVGLLNRALVRWRCCVAYRVLSDPARREKYDVYGIADEQGFKCVLFKHSCLQWRHG